MPTNFALTLSKMALDVAARLVKANVRVVNLDKLEDDDAVIFVVNHFTRLETLLLPYVIFQRTGKEVWGLAADELFQGRVGKFLRACHAVSTKDPDRDKMIVHGLLKGENPWMIFPEGSMIKDKKVVDPSGEYSVYSQNGRRPPHTGAAVLALRAEFYRAKLDCLRGQTANGEGAALLKRFGLDSIEEAVAKRTVIIPVNITYYPIRARDNALLRVAAWYSSDLSERAVEELSVEGTVLSEDTDIDITFGDPIDVREYLNDPEYAELMACGPGDMDLLERDPASRFNEAARSIMKRYMEAIYHLTTINYDHILATLLRYQPLGRAFSERAYRNRIFLSVHEIRQLGRYRLHGLLAETYRRIIYEEPDPRLSDFLDLCLREGVILKRGDAYVRNPGRRFGQAAFHQVRTSELSYVIANELEPLAEPSAIVRRAARMPRFWLSKKVRDFFLAEDIRAFEEDYAKYYDAELSKGPDVGRPFLLRPLRPKAGIVLAHGYMAAPLEVRALGEYFYRRGYAVYGVRLKGHGTSPEDLAQSTWQEWYESFNRGYAIIKSLTDRIVLCGFSTGGCLALMGAARKGTKIRAAVSICAPLSVRSTSIRFVPSLVRMNTLLKRIGRNRTQWEYVENVPENTHINYTKNPLTGAKQLLEIMGQTEAALPNVQVPTLVVQASKDPTVHPDSGPAIFEGLGTPFKQLLVVENARHGIVNGVGSEEVFAGMHLFLERVLHRAALPAAADTAAR